MKKFKRILVVGAATTMLLGNVLNVSAAGLHDIFDAKYYADSYADLKEAFGYDQNLLYQHFITYGLKEGRNMSPILNVVAYREAYGDLNAAFGDNWDAYVDHFFTFGAREMRDKGVLFNPVVYADAYGDIKAVYGDNLTAIAEHYLTFGRAEHRTLGTSGSYADMAAAKLAEWKDQQTAQSSQQPIKPAMPSSSWDSNGHTEYIYDDQGNCITEIYYDFEGNKIRTFNTIYNSNGDIVYHETRDAEGNLESYSEYVYDGKKLQKESFYNGNGTITSSSIYEWNGNKVKISDYDESGNLAGCTECEADDNFNFTRKVYYDSNGVLLGSDECTYDKDGNMLTALSYNAAGEVTDNVAYTYYANGVMKTFTYIRDTQKRVSEYNENGNELSSKIYLDGKLIDTWTNEYYTEGPLKISTRSVYEEQSYSTEESFFDRKGKLSKQNTKINYSDGSSKSIVTECADDGSSTTSYKYYDSEGLLTKESIDIRNAQGELIKCTDYTLEADGSTKSVTVTEYENSRIVKEITYDADGETVLRSYRYAYLDTDYGYDQLEYHDDVYIKTFMYAPDGSLLGERCPTNDSYGAIVESWSNTHELRYYSADGKLLRKILRDEHDEITAVYEYDEYDNEIALVKNKNGDWVRPTKDSDINELMKNILTNDSVSVNITDSDIISGSVSDGDAVTGDVSGNNAADN